MTELKRHSIFVSPETLEKVISITGRGRKYKTIEQLADTAVRRVFNRPLATGELLLFNILRARLAHEMSMANAGNAREDAGGKRKDDQRVGTRLDAELSDLVNRTARATRIPASNIIELAIEDFLENPPANDN